MSGQRGISFFITGGTIDSRSSRELDGKIVPCKISLVRKYLEGRNFSFRTRIHEICLKDSRDITDEDRHALLQAIADGEDRHNVVIHGTFTLPQTARFLLEHQTAIRDKVIALTGAETILMGAYNEIGEFEASDGPLNIGISIQGAFNADNGIYIAMNGGMFKQPDEPWYHDEKTGAIHYEKKYD